jgi:O-antigen/teichoic acid export membrane protein
VRALLRGDRATVALFGLGTIAYQGGRLILNLLAAAILGPVLFGTWVLLSLLIGYSGSLSLGIVNGANREIPFLSGAGRHAEAERVEDVALTASIGGAVIAVALAVIIGPLLITGEVETTWIAVALFGGALAFQQFFALQQVLFRSRMRFRAAAMQLLILGVAIPIIGAPLLTFGLEGILSAQVLVFLVALGLGTWLLPRVPRLTWDGALARRTAGIGFPIMVAGLVAAVRTTTDRWLVLAFLGRVEVGYYGLVGVVMGGLLVLSGIVSQQFYPRLAYAHGEGRSGAELLAMAGRQNLYAASLVAAAAAPAAIGGWFLIPVVLPEYQPAVVPLMIVLAGVVLASASSGFGNLLNTVGAHRRYLAIQTLGLAMNVGLATSLLIAGAGIVGVAVAAAVSMTLYSLILRFSAKHAVVRLGSRAASAKIPAR